MTYVHTASKPDLGACTSPLYSANLGNIAKVVYCCIGAVVIVRLGRGLLYTITSFSVRAEVV